MKEIAHVAPTENRSSPPSRSLPWPPVPRAPRRQRQRAPSGGRPGAAAGHAAAAIAAGRPRAVAAAAAAPPPPRRAAAAGLAAVAERRPHARRGLRPAVRDSDGRRPRRRLVHAHAAEGAFGTGNQTWAFTVFGTIQADYITDTTRSYNDYIGQQLVARSDTLRRGGRAARSSGCGTRASGSCSIRRPSAAWSPSAVFQRRLRGQSAVGSVRSAGIAGLGRHLGERLLQQPDGARPPRVPDAAQSGRRHPRRADVRRLRLAELLRAVRAARAPEPGVVAHRAVPAVAQLRRGRAGGGRRRRRGGAPRAARLAGARHRGRRPRQPSRLEGDHDAGQRGDDRGAVLVRRLGHHPPVQGQRLHAAAGADVEPADRAGASRATSSSPSSRPRTASTIAATG